MAISDMDQGDIDVANQAQMVVGAIEDDGEADHLGLRPETEDRQEEEDGSG